MSRTNELADCVKRSLERYFKDMDGEKLPAPGLPEIGALLLEHLEGLYDLYGEEQGARVARKHIGWTVRGLAGGEEFRRLANGIVEAEAQLRAVRAFFLSAANDPRSNVTEERRAA